MRKEGAKYRQYTQQDQQQREGYFFTEHREMACHFYPSQVLVNIFNGCRCLIYQDTNCQCQSAQGHDIDRLPKQAQQQ